MQFWTEIASKKGKVLPNPEKSRFAVEMTLRERDDHPFPAEFLPRSRSLETPIERGFPRSHSDGVFGSPIWRTLKSPEKRKVLQILVQNRLFEPLRISKTKTSGSTAGTWSCLASIPRKAVIRAKSWWLSTRSYSGGSKLFLG